MAKFSTVEHAIPIPLESGEVFSWSVRDPPKLLELMLAESPELAELYFQRLQQHPPPWDIIVGYDEFAPGNKLRVDNRRKCTVLSFSFVQLGRAALSSETAWFTPVVVRHKVLGDAKGGWSHMLAEFLAFLLFSPRGFSTGGVPLELHGHNFLLTARLSHVLSDGDGLRLGFNWKGASGMKPCIRHHNVFSRESDMCARREGYCDITCSDPSAFQMWEKEDLETTVDTLAAAIGRAESGTMTRKRLNDLQKVVGFNAATAGVLADRRLRGIDWPQVITYDWVHAALQDGLVTTELFCFMKAASAKAGFSASQWEQHLKRQWSFPAHFKSKGNQLFRVFDEYRTRSSNEADRLKTSASELLSLVCLLRHFVDHAFSSNDSIKAELESLRLAFGVVDIVLGAKRGVVSMATSGIRLRDTMAKYMRAHIAVYGPDKVRPKAHWLFDVAEQLQRHPLVFDAFIVERLHLRVKHVAEPVKNTTTFEKSVLAGVVNRQAQGLEQHEFASGLRGQTAPFPGCIGAFIADRMDVDSLTVSVDDVVLCAGVAGRVLACAREADILFCVVAMMRRLARASGAGVLWAHTEEIQIWPAAAVVGVVAWRDAAGGVLVISHEYAAPL